MKRCGRPAHFVLYYGVPASPPARSMAAATREPKCRSTEEGKRDRSRSVGAAQDPVLLRFREAFFRASNSLAAPAQKAVPAALNGRTLRLKASEAHYFQGE